MKKKTIILLIITNMPAYGMESIEESMSLRGLNHEGKTQEIIFKPGRMKLDDIKYVSKARAEVASKSEKHASMAAAVSKLIFNNPELKPKYPDEKASKEYCYQSLNNTKMNIMNF